MEENKELNFKVMVTSVDVLQKEIERFNKFRNTDFEIIEVIEEVEVFFCKIRTTSRLENIFSLGFGLACYEEELRKKREIDW